jgi:hypothetical protein
MNDRPADANTLPQTTMSARQVLRPSTLILLIANLFPLYGIAYWGWDAFVLLMLYWMETGIIAF